MSEPTAAALREMVRPEDVISFFDKTTQPHDDAAACRLWTGSCNPRGGYGRYKKCGHHWVAHRFAYKLMVGEIPAGLTLDHLCRTTNCVNPFHLEPVTVAENIRRGTQGWNFRVRTHCPRGHVYDEANTAIGVKGDRRCRACARERARERRAR
jgi:hypothetical protein